jgi:hypothetical protein
MHAQSAQADGASAQLRSDNLALYERIRFVQHYQREGKHGAAEAGVGFREGAGPGAATMSKYEAAYEEGINPFQEFRRHEREGNFKVRGEAGGRVQQVSLLAWRGGG